MNKELLEIKKQMQGARNILKDLQGIQVIHLYEPGEGTIAQINLEKMGVLSGYKEPDMVLEYNETYQTVADFLKVKTGLANGQKIYLLLSNGIWSEVQILDVDQFIKSYFHSEYRNSFGIAFIDSDMKKMYEYGSDSRDEYHLLYDEYEVLF
ncbi:MAG: hypothetical protein SOW14_08270 [Agathobacter sp.]|nr:hypothetical protein [Lachnospiraceae bacterium]MDY2620598.1 hypothetical protein [Agathobacter sp.]